MNQTSHSENISEIALALSKVQGSMKHAAKTADNPFFKSKYADLPAVWDACKSQLSENQIAVFQGGEECREGEFILSTTLIHSSGQWLKSKLPISLIIPATPEKTDRYGKVTPASTERRMNPQEVGSCLTYFRRYGLCCAVGICADEDDDGNKASRNESQASKPSNISAIQSEQLKAMLDKVPEYKSFILKHLNDQFGITSLSEITVEMFNGIMKEALKALDKKQPTKTEKIA